MGSSVATNDVRTLANGVRRGLNAVRGKDAIARSAANSPPNSARFRGWVRDAMRRAGLSQKAFAINCQQPESVISEALSGSRQFHAEWIDAQSDEFVAVLALVMAEGRRLPTPRDLALDHLTEAVRLLSQEVA